VFSIFGTFFITSGKSEITEFKNEIEKKEWFKKLDELGDSLRVLKNLKRL